jgi:hypothetical protein
LGTITFPVYCAEAYDQKFSITNVPEWLHIESTSERFDYGTAYIVCHASTYDEYNKYGLYNIVITLNIEGVGQYLIPVCYVNEGMPSIAVDEPIELQPSVPQPTLKIVNKGKGILIWNIVKYPEWINIDFHRVVNILFPDESVELFVTYNEIYLLTEAEKSGQVDRLTGDIVIVSNDAKQSTIIVKVSYSFENTILWDAN